MVPSQAGSPSDTSATNTAAASAVRVAVKTLRKGENRVRKTLKFFPKKTMKIYLTFSVRLFARGTPDGHLQAPQHRRPRRDLPRKQAEVCEVYNSFKKNMMSSWPIFFSAKISLQLPDHGADGGRRPGLFPPKEQAQKLADTTGTRRRKILRLYRGLSVYESLPSSPLR